MSVFEDLELSRIEKDRREGENAERKNVKTNRLWHTTNTDLFPKGTSSL